VAITPSTAVTYSGTPFTFLISGGKGPYTILTSDQTALPVVGTLNGNALVVVPGSVGTDTAVTLSVRDTTGQSTTAAVTVKPQLLLPTSITVTGNTNCAAAGGTLCSGQNGTASVLVIGPNSAPLANRPVRFDVVQGDFAFVNPGGGAPAPSITATTDQNGFAVVTLTVPASATTQIATIRATDLTSGNAISSNFTIVAFNDGSAVLSVVPTTATVKGPPASPPVCAVGAPINYYVFGGTPPYTISLTVPKSPAASSPLLRTVAWTSRPLSSLTRPAASRRLRLRACSGQTAVRAAAGAAPAIAAVSRHRIRPARRWARRLFP
jgi:hypothetical protein